MRLLDQAQYDATDQSLRLTCTCPGAERVFVMGEFLFGQPRMLAMKPSGEHQWSIALELPPGEYRYRYYVEHDGALTFGLPEARAELPPLHAWDAVLCIGPAGVRESRSPLCEPSPHNSAEQPVHTLAAAS